jgi:hypothetical protein
MVNFHIRGFLDKKEHNFTIALESSTIHLAAALSLCLRVALPTAATKTNTNIKYECLEKLLVKLCSCETRWHAVLARSQGGGVFLATIFGTDGSASPLG